MNMDTSWPHFLNYFKSRFQVQKLKNISWFWPDPNGASPDSPTRPVEDIQVLDRLKYRTFVGQISKENGTIKEVSEESSSFYLF